MKQYLTLVFVGTVVLTSLAYQVQGQTKTASATPTLKPTASAEDKQLQNFKDQIATKVAELQKNRKAIAGLIQSNSGATITIKTTTDDVYTIKIDDTLTKFYKITGTTKKDEKQTDLKKGDFIIASGPVLDKSVEANVVYQDEQLFTKSGKITEVDTDKDIIKVTTTEKDDVVIDIPSSLRLQSVNSKTLAIESTTLSKIKEGDTIHFVYKKAGTEKDNNEFTAVKVLVIFQEYFQKK